MTARPQYEKIRDQLISALDRTATLYSKKANQSTNDTTNRELIKYAEHLRQHVQRIKKEEFVVVIIGEMKRGKSTMLNALMGRSILTMDVLEATATVSFLRHNETAQEITQRNHAVVHFTDSRPTAVVPLNDLIHYSSRLSRFGEQNVADTVDHADIFIDSPFLRSNVMLVDTPGTNSTHETHIRITYEQINRSHAAIFLLNANAAFTQADRNFFHDIQDKIGQFFFILNRIDEIADNQHIRVIEDAQHKLKQVIESSSPLNIYAISALKALLSRHGYLPDTTIWKSEQPDTKEWRSKLFKESRMDEFEQELEKYLFQGGKTRDLLQSPVNFLLATLTEAKKYLEQQREVLNGSFDFTKIEQNEKELSLFIEQYKLECDEQGEKLTRRLNDSLKNEIEQLTEDLEREKESLKDMLNTISTVQEMRDNWENGLSISTYPQNRLAAFVNRADRKIKEALESVFEVEQRKLKKRIHELLSNSDNPIISMELIPSIQLVYTEPHIDEKEQQEIHRRQQELENLDMRIGELSASDHLPIIQQELEDLKQKRQHEQNELSVQYQQLGTRPEPIIKREIVESTQSPKGIFGFIGWIFFGPSVKETLVERIDRSEQEIYERDKAIILERYQEKITTIETKIQNAKTEKNKASLEQLQKKKIEEERQKKEALLHEAKRSWDQRKNHIEENAMKINRRQILDKFSRSCEMFIELCRSEMKKHKQLIQQFLDQTIEQLNEELANKRHQLHELQQLKQTKQAELTHLLAELDEWESQLQIENTAGISIKQELEKFFGSK